MPAASSLGSGGAYAQPWGWKSKKLSCRLTGALTAQPAVGVILPCNVCVSREGRRTVVHAVDPESALSLLDHAAVAAVACEVAAALRRVMARWSDSAWRDYFNGLPRGPTATSRPSM